MSAVSTALDLALHASTLMAATATDAVAMPPGTHFEIVFDVVREGYKAWWFPAIGLLFISLGLVTVFAPDWIPAASIWTTSRKRVFGEFFLVFATIWTLSTFALTHGDYSSLEEKTRLGECQVSEGFVRNFSSPPRGGRGAENFDVGRSHFEYREFVMTAGFNQTSANGGPMREGLYVRICHVGKEIGRLEIWR